MLTLYLQPGRIVTDAPKPHFTDVTNDPLAKLPHKFTRPWVYWRNGRAYAETEKLKAWRDQESKIE